MIERIAAIVRADFLIRFRRVSTVVVFLLLSAMAYVWVPDPRTGRALIQIDGHRALYNSAAIGMATALLGTIFIGLFGFYVISNALRRDVQSRCGFVIASTTVRNGEYLLGKFVGNVVFLVTFVAGYMVTSMAMLVVRGEAPLEPWTFFLQYLYTIPPAIVFVSALAILFESIPWLSGKFGDVVYFFLWASSLGVVASMIEKGADPGIAGFFDFSGFGYLMDQMHNAFHTNSLSIGSSSFDAAKPVIVFPGLTMPFAWMVRRVAAMLLPLPLLGVALVFFHRFDPVRVRKSADKGRRNWIGRINMLFKPFARGLFLLGARAASRPTMLRSAFADAMMSIAATPIAVAIAAFFGLFAFASRESLPLALAALGVLLADVPTRERRSGTTGLVYSAPFLRSRFVLWKLLAMVLLSALLLIGPIIRTPTPQLAVGILFICAAAVALGVISGNPKAFIVAYLTFWYVSTNDHGLTPALDFAGAYGKATPAVTAVYLMLAMTFVIAAQAMHVMRLRRA
ncbi:MAG TPA: hypothetical protein VJ276_08070 [Thermoanaerobaculia bacterium]|nr:hypothetical protein [Thermoanaerobaculia bacterium]